MKPFPVARFPGVLLLLSAILTAPGSLRAQGIALTGVGPVNRSMGGAATAAPLDAAGAIHWNPATISGLASSEVMFGLELLLPTEELASQIDAGALGGGVPPITLAGSDRGEPGVSPIPHAAWVHKSADSPWTYGLGLFGIAGFRVDYPGSTTNPILTPQPTAGGLGLGRISAEAEFFQIVPTVSYALSPKLAIGVAPTVTLARIAVDPLVVAPPVGGLYTSGRETRYHWGGGVQAGIYYIADAPWRLGLSIKSPQWLEDFRFHTEDGAGGSRVVKLDLDYPMIVSLGWAYSGIERWVIACDLRYFDYENTPGFGDTTGFDPAGAVTGLGWNSLFSVSSGVQYRASNRLYLRLGYTYQQNPISSTDTFFNVACPLIIEHLAAVGASYRLTPNVFVSATYIHGFENESTGPLHVPGVGPLPSTSVSSRISADALNVGVTVQY